MQKIPLKLAKAGMKLAKPVTNDRGMTLCGVGIELTEEMINRLSNMGVARITVEGHPIDTGESVKSLRQLIDELNVRFKPVEGDPLMIKIKSILLERFKKKTGEE